MYEFFDLFMNDAEYFAGTIGALVGAAFVTLVIMAMAGVFDRRRS